VRVKNSQEPREKLIIKPETWDVRPYVCCAILRNIKFDIQSYNSFIDFQDKLHQSICHKRELASMGTHDYNKVKGPINYVALPPEEIVFKALK